MIHRIEKLLCLLCFIVKCSQSNKAGSTNRDEDQKLISGYEPPKDLGIDRGPSKGGGAKQEKHRFTTRSTTLKRYARTTPPRISFEENCDYLAHYCLKAYNTGKLCARTLYYTYHTFKNYCMLDYVNCMERYEVWQVVHMGECFNVTLLTEYLLYPYDDDYFLDQYYILEDH